MSRTERLTDRFIMSLEPQRFRLEIADAACPGLWLRVTPEGVKTFAIRYRMYGKPLRYTIGRYPTVKLSQARIEAQKAFENVRNGTDPRHRKWDENTIDRHVTLSYVLEDYLGHLGKNVRGKRLKASHVAEVKRRLNAEVVPALGERPFSTLGRDAFEKLLNSIEKRAPRVSAHIFYDLRVFYRWAMQKKLIEASPMDAIEAPLKPEPRDRVLQEDELRAIWLQCSSTATAYTTIVKLLALTAQRRGEVTGAAWAEFDFDKGIWTIPKTRTKNGREHRLPMSTLALEVLRDWRARQTPGEPMVFPSQGSSRTSFSGFSRCKRRLDAQAGVTAWRVHDLRRTAATCMAELGTAPHVVERILNHAGGTMTPIARVYNRATYEAEMRAALEKWSHKLTSLEQTYQAELAL